MLGLIGGLCWESTQVYYRLINEGARARLGGARSARMVIWSFDFTDMADLVDEGRWDEASALTVDAARKLEEAGAAFVMIGCNTMHLAAEDVAAGIGVPFLHIADCLGRRVAGAAHKRIGLLGTRTTMESGFYAERLRGFGLEILIPEEDEREAVHDIIHRELVMGRVAEPSRRKYRQVIQALAARGAEAVVLGCTEIGLLVSDADSDLPVFDTTAIHAEEAVAAALA
jgi:aspartate racemase